MDKFVVSYSPFARSSNDINKMFIYTAISLLLPTIFGCVFFGYTSIFVVLTSVAVCFLSECLFNVITAHKFRVTDLSFLVTGLIMGLTLPVKMPIYIVAVSAFVADFIAKMVFGGLGKNKFNPALVGRLFAGIFASTISTNLYALSLKGEELVSLSAGGENTIIGLLKGEAVGGIGTTCAIIILIAYVFLVYMSVIDWKIPLISFISYFIVAFLLNGVESAILNILSGSFLFVSVFMMTDPNTSPNTFLGKLLYSILFGGLSALVWKMGKIGEDTVFAVALFVDMLVPFMDKYLVVKQKPLGGYRYAH